MNQLSQDGVGTILNEVLTLVQMILTIVEMLYEAVGFLPFGELN